MTGIQYRIVVGLCVPAVLALIGILGKRLTRGRAGSWKRSDLYLGVEFSLAGISAAVVNLFDLLLKPSKVPLVVLAGQVQNQIPPVDVRLVVANFLIAFIGMVVFMFVLILHQDYENEGNVTKARTKELWILAGAANTLGCAVLLAGVAVMPL
jgi:hypothetical protein